MSPKTSIEESIIKKLQSGNKDEILDIPTLMMNEQINLNQLITTAADENVRSETLALALSDCGYELLKGDAVWRFIDFERTPYVDISYGTADDVSLTQSIFPRHSEEKINDMTIRIPSIKDMFILNACHSIDACETDAMWDAKRIYERIDMKIVQNELRNQSGQVKGKVNRRLMEFVGGEK